MLNLHNFAISCKHSTLVEQNIKHGSYDTTGVVVGSIGRDVADVASSVATTVSGAESS